MNDKSDEEKERIAKAKMSNGKSYSIVSQSLFKQVYDLIDYDDVYFATKHHNGIYDDGNNDEYIVHTHNDRIRFLDFYIPSIKKCIEFDGDYWHGKKPGNKERDFIREQEIKDSITGIDILHIKECEYKKNPDAIVNMCLEFLQK